MKQESPMETMPHRSEPDTVAPVATAAPRRGLRRRTAVLGAVGAGALVLGLLAGCGGGSSSSSDTPDIPSTTFPTPPGAEKSVDDIINGGAKTTFTSPLAPTKIVDDYLQNFAVIGWTTLSKEGNDTKSVLKLQGGNRYATIVVTGAGGSSNGVVCQGTDQAVVNQCALGG